MTHHRAVYIEPPVTHKVLLVVQRAVGTEQRAEGSVLHTTPARFLLPLPFLSRPPVVTLTLGLRIGIEAGVELCAGERSDRRPAVDGEVLPRAARQACQTDVASCLIDRSPNWAWAAPTTLAIAGEEGMSNSSSVKCFT